MTRYCRYITLFVCLCMTLTLSAQRSKKRPVKKPVTEEAPVDPRLERMTQNTQRIVFIDSVVVPRNELLSKVRLTPQAGIVTREQQGSSYQNEIGTRRIFARDNRLYTSQRVNGMFTDEEEVRGVFNAGVIDTLDCPFLMNDGQTLYFAAKGSESIGGYDIFVTRYNSETRTFLKPENIGMPFNSTDDDLLYIIDEGSNIGWFATTRRQPEGYACLYTFIPVEARQTYDGVTPEALKRLAAIGSIADTWGNGQQRKEALTRLSNISSRQEEAPQPQMRFVINDKTTYTSITDFRASSNVTRYQQLLDLQAQLDETARSLHASRTLYGHATPTKRQQLSDEIRSTEAQLERLQLDIRQLEKDIRNSENKLLKQ